MNPPTEISTMGPNARVAHGNLTHLALPVGAYRVVNVICPPCGERVVRARRPLQLVIPLRDGGLSGRSSFGLGKEPEGAKMFVRF
jgi:hypothetical protein